MASPSLPLRQSGHALAYLGVVIAAAGWGTWGWLLRLAQAAGPVAPQLTALLVMSTIFLVLLPLAFWLGETWVQTALLAGSVLLVMIVELLNTGIETAIDRIGPEWHDLSKRAKDMGSAAVLLSLLLCSGIWLAAFWNRFA